MGRKKRQFQIEFHDEQYVVRCRKCRKLAKVSYTRGPRVRVSCECDAETQLKVSSWSKYLRTTKAPEVSRIEKPLGDGTAVKTLSRDPPNLDETSEFVTVDGMTVPRKWHIQAAVYPQATGPLGPR